LRQDIMRGLCRLLTYSSQLVQTPAIGQRSARSLLHIHGIY